MTKRHAISILVVAVVGLLIGGGWYAYRADNSRRQGTSSSPALTNSPAISSNAAAQGVSVIELSDNRNLLGAYHYFFVAKVIDQGERRQVDMFTLNQYIVDVIYDIKGDLHGAITVHDTDPLELGATYIMGARWNWHNLQQIGISHAELLTKDAMLTNTQLKTIAEKNDRVIALEKAYPNEKLISSDVLYNTSWNSYESLQAGKLFVPGTTDPYPVKIRYLDWAANDDLATDTKLVGLANYIFAGKVLSRLDDGHTTIPMTRFRVEVVLNIKGNLSGQIALSQPGRFSEDGSCIIIRRKGDPEYPGGCADAILRLGTTYLFIARYDKDTSSLQLLFAPQYDQTVISGDSGLDLGTLKTIAENNRRVKALKAAYPNELVPETDRRYHQDFNNYESLKSGHLFTPPPFVTEVTDPPAS